MPLFGEASPRCEGSGWFGHSCRDGLAWASFIACKPGLVAPVDPSKRIYCKKGLALVDALSLLLLSFSSSYSSLIGLDLFVVYLLLVLKVTQVTQLDSELTIGNDASFHVCVSIADCPSCC